MGEPRTITQATFRKSQDFRVKYFCQGLENKAFWGVASILFNIAPTCT